MRGREGGWVREGRDDTAAKEVSISESMTTSVPALDRNYVSMTLRSVERDVAKKPNQI